MKKTVLTLALAGLSLIAAPGQTSGPRTPRAPQPLPGDLQAIAPESIAPRSVAAWFALSVWESWGPPCPMNCWPGFPLYWSPTLGPETIFADDTEAVIRRALAANGIIPEGVGDDPGDPPPTDDHQVNDLGTNTTDLWLSITYVTNQIAPLVMHNTTNGTPYEIRSSQFLTNAFTNWNSEGIWVGLPTNTPANIAVGIRTTALYFRARVWNPSFGFPTNNGQLLLLTSGTNAIFPIINGVTNTVRPFYNNWAMLNPPLYTVNLGYDANDAGFTNSIVNTNGQQGIQQLLGFSTTCTNLLLAYNPLTNISVSGWPNLQTLECWHCTNLISANVTNCPQLRRLCFGVLSLSGCKPAR